jgi:hypothetical protein
VIGEQWSKMKLGKDEENVRIEVEVGRRGESPRRISCMILRAHLLSVYYQPCHNDLRQGK